MSDHNPYGYWTMFGGPDPDPDPTLISPDPTSTAPPAPDPVYHSVITGTFDPTPAAIIAAAAASGTPVPPGIDPVEFSRMMSGLPPIPVSTATSVPPLGSSASLSPSSFPPVSMPPASSFSLPSWGTSSGVSGSPFTAAMKALSFDGGGGLLCDPITGKCPTYR